MKLLLRFYPYTKKGTNVTQYSVRIPQECAPELKVMNDEKYPVAKFTGDFIAIVQNGFIDSVRNNQSAYWICDFEISPSRAGLFFVVPIEQAQNSDFEWDASGMDSSGRLIPISKNACPQFKGPAINTEIDFNINGDRSAIIATLKTQDSLSIDSVGFTEDLSQVIHPLLYFRSLQYFMETRVKMLGLKMRILRIDNIDNVIITPHQYKNTTIYRWIPKQFEGCPETSLNDVFAEFSSKHVDADKVWATHAYFSKEAHETFREQFHIRPIEKYAYVIGEYFITLPKVEKETVTVVAPTEEVVQS